MWPLPPHAVRHRGRTARAQWLCSPPSAGALHICPLRPLFDRRRMGRDEVVAFFRFLCTCSGDEANVGGFVVETGSRRTTTANRRAGTPSAVGVVVVTEKQGRSKR